MNEIIFNEVVPKPTEPGKLVVIIMAHEDGELVTARGIAPDDVRIEYIDAFGVDEVVTARDDALARVAKSELKEQTNDRD